MEENEIQFVPVGQLTRYIRAKFDQDPQLQQIPVTGEISNYRPRPNAHQYFSLKDETAKINVVLFKQQAAALQFDLEEGMAVNIIGRISVYEPSGNYQLYAERIEPVGVGSLYQAFRQLVDKLEKEGVFTRPKKTLVEFPKKIAVITSASGAVIRDIMTTVKRRYPQTELVLFPALVQGEKAASDVTRQLQRADESQQFDDIIIARGGGSIEDLSPFNDEGLARAILAAKTPIISSVGHETDTTIADLVADVRAATPTAAAELATPNLPDLLIQVNQQKERMTFALQQRIEKAKARLNRVKTSYIIQDPQRLYQSKTQQVDVFKMRLINAFTQLTSQARSRLSNNAKALELVSPLAILGRGYALVTGDNGQAVKQIADVEQNEIVNIQLDDGLLKANILGKAKE